MFANRRHSLYLCLLSCCLFLKLYVMRILFSFSLLLAVSPEVLGQSVRINELRTGLVGTIGVQEYVELAGPPGTSLDGLSYLVIGDSPEGRSGVVEHVTTGGAGTTLPDDGLFVIGEGLRPGLSDVEALLNFEDHDNVTHLLVRGFTGTNGDDLDLDDDGTLDVTPWAEVLDAVGLEESTTIGDPVYAGQLGGPVVSLVTPGHAWRDGETSEWRTGYEGQTFAEDTPGAANSTLVGVPPVFSLASSRAYVLEGETFEVPIVLDYPDDRPDGLPVTLLVGPSHFPDIYAGLFFERTTQYLTFDGTADDDTLAVRYTVVEDGIPGTNGLQIYSLGTGVAEGEATRAPGFGFGVYIVNREAPRKPRLQLVHNAPDPVMHTLDVTLTPTGGNEATVFEDLAFRSATRFADIDGGTYEVTVSDSADPSVVYLSQTVTLEAARKYQLTVAGVADPSRFAPNPDGQDISARVLVNPNVLEPCCFGIETTSAGFTHAAPDAPAIDLYNTRIVPGNNIVFGSFSPDYDGSFGFNAVSAETSEGSVDLGGVSLPFQPDGDFPSMVQASGFLSPEANQNGPAFGLMIVTPGGSTSLFSEQQDAVQTAASLNEFALRGAYPNPFATRATIVFDLPADASVGLDLFDVLGRRVLSRAPEPVTAGADRRLAVEAALPSGVYVFRLTAETAGGRLVESGRMTVVR